MKRNKQLQKKPPKRFRQPEDAVLRYLELVAKAWRTRDAAGITPIEHRGGPIVNRSKVAAQ